MKLKQLERNDDLQDIIKKISDKDSEYGRKIKNKYFDEEGNIVIDLLLSNDNLYNTYASERQETLNPEIFDFLDNSITVENKPVKINIITDIKNKNDREEIIDLLQQHYYLNLVKTKRKYKRDFWKALLLLAFGSIFLVIYLVLSLTNNAYMTELISIIGSFAVWESMDFFLLERGEVRQEYIRAINMLMSEIVFEDEKK